jgi:hypothetical protein
MQSTFRHFAAQALLTGFLSLVCRGHLHAQTDRSEAIPRALAYLSREVPAWASNHDCYSCHNNGDAARALLAASERGYSFGREALAGTLEWLKRPESWDDAPTEAEFRDQQLAAIQFAAATGHAARAQLMQESEPVAAAAGKVAAIQRPDGSWRLDRSGLGGSPIVYPDALATALSRQLLVQAGRERFAAQIDLADRWLRSARPHATAQAAAVVLGLDQADDPPALAQRQRFAQLAQRAQHDSGAWGPFVGHSAEPFDSALVLLALDQLESTGGASSEVQRMISKGRRWLIATQNADGSWTETTRPAGSESYAHRISTTAWVLLALLATEEKDEAAD